MTDTAASATTLPEGDYAIVELLGHRTLVGRIEEVERFGTKLIKVEVIFNDQLLPPVYHGGGAIYGFLPCSAERAFRHQAREVWQLPEPLREAVPPALLAPPQGDLPFGANRVPDDDDAAQEPFDYGEDAEQPF